MNNAKINRALILRVAERHGLKTDSFITDKSTEFTNAEQGKLVPEYITKINGHSIRVEATQVLLASGVNISNTIHRRRRRQ